MTFSRATAEQAIIKEPQFMTPVLALVDALRREGRHDEAREQIASEMGGAGADDVALRLACAISLAKVERSAGHPALALKVLLEASPLAELCGDDELRARFHHGLGVTYQTSGETGAAVIEYTAAAYYWNEAGSPYDAGCVENNLSLLLAAADRIPEAHTHIGRARSYFTGMAVKLAEVDESEAQILLSEGKPAEAERLVIGAMKVFYDYGEAELLRQARYTLLRASAEAQASGSRLRAKLTEGER